MMLKEGGRGSIKRSGREKLTNGDQRMTLSMSTLITSLSLLQPHSDQRFFFTKCINLSPITTSSFAPLKCNSSVADDNSSGVGSGDGSLDLKEDAEAKLVRLDHINQLRSKASEMKGEEGGMIDKYAHKLESVKAASISAIVGTLAALPLALTRASSCSDLILPLTITSFSCALFGATFLYTIRRDVDNVHLKSGTCAAFGFVKGLGEVGAAGPPLELEMGSLVQHAFYVSEDLVTFFFAAFALDLCIKFKYLTPINSQ